MVNTMDRPLNVLRVITWLPVGGIERKILAVLPRLDPARFRVRVVCLRERGALAGGLERSGIPVDVSPMPSRLSPRGLLRLARHMREHHVDIVHAHMYRSSIPATIAAHLARVPVIVSQVHNVATWETRRQLWLDRALCRWRTAMVAVSESVRRDVIATLRIGPERVRVIYNGVDLAAFGAAGAAGAAGGARAAKRAELGLGHEDIAIVYHGRLVAQKNPDALLRIAVQIAMMRKGVRVIVVGDGPCREDLERRAREAGVCGGRGEPQRMFFLGQRSDIPELLQACDIAVLPSFKEGFSNAVIEALAAGLPVVATDVGGNAEAVEHGRSGWIVPPGNEGALLSAVKSLVDDPSERSRMGAAAALRAQRFGLDRMVGDVEDLYTDLAQQAGLIVASGTARQ
jgi:glycosyltransferase involved in cell wall biosynthesis